MLDPSVLARPVNLDLLWRKFELLRMRWRLTTGRVYSDPNVLPAALDWLDGQIAEMEESL